MHIQRAWRRRQPWLPVLRHRVQAGDHCQGTECEYGGVVLGYYVIVIKYHFKRWLSKVKC